MAKLHSYIGGSAVTNMWTDASHELSSCGLRFFVATIEYDKSAELTLTPGSDLFACALPDTYYDEIFEFRFDAQRVQRLQTNHAGNALFVPRGSRYEAKHAGSASGAGLVCQIEDSAYDDIVGPGQRPPPAPYYGNVQMSLDVVERLARVCGNPSAYPLIYTESLATILISDIHREFGGRSLGLDQGADKNAMRLRNVLEYVEACIDRDFGISDLAELSGMSMTQFSGAFKSHVGCSPYRYVIQRRIAQAKLFLRTTDETMDAIAAKVGFRSAAGFGRFFVREVGLTPGAYRSGTGNRIRIGRRPASCYDLSHEADHKAPH